jgi:hypothetical protein
LLLSLFLFRRQFPRRSVRIEGAAIDYFECGLFFGHGFEKAQRAT